MGEESSRLKVYKSLYRNKLRRLLAQLKPRLKSQKSGQISKKLLKTRAFREAKSILLYMSMDCEVSTVGILKKALALKKSVFIPCVTRGGELEIVRILRGQKFRKSCYGIQEPHRSGRKKEDPSAIDLVLVPGLGFDRKGARLGRGGGHFDRLLKQTGRAQKIALAFREQILDQLPVEKHDVRVDQVMTD